MSDLKFYFWYGLLAAGAVSIACLLDRWCNRCRRRQS